VKRAPEVKKFEPEVKKFGPEVAKEKRKDAGETKEDDADRREELLKVVRNFCDSDKETVFRHIFFSFRSSRIY
jgi:hypothetical protein